MSSCGTGPGSSAGCLWLAGERDGGGGGGGAGGGAAVIFCLACGGVGEFSWMVAIGDGSGGGDERFFGAERFGVDELGREVVIELDLLESEECFLPFFGLLTHPARVTDNSGALLARLWF